MRPTQDPSTVSRRPLRWLKFSVLFFFASTCMAKALPVARVFIRLGEAPYVFHPEPLLGPALALLATIVFLIWIVLDAAFDRLIPRGAVAALLLLAASPWKVEERSSAEEVAHLRRAARQVAAELSARWARGESLSRLREAAPKDPGPYLSRWFRRLPHELRFLPAGISLPEEEGAPPGTFFVSLSEEGGWLSVSRAGGASSRLLRSEGAIEVFRISPRRGEHEL